MSDPNLFALGPCYTCKNIFRYDPERVLSVFVDPQTNRPPDVDAEGDQVELSMDEFRATLERAIRKPICPDCVERLNASRAARGLGPLRASM